MAKTDCNEVCLSAWFFFYSFCPVFIQKIINTFHHFHQVVVRSQNILSWSHEGRASAETDSWLFCCKAVLANQQPPCKTVLLQRRRGCLWFHNLWIKRLCSIKKHNFYQLFQLSKIFLKLKEVKKIYFESVSFIKCQNCRINSKWRNIFNQGYGFNYKGFNILMHLWMYNFCLNDN